MAIRDDILMLLRRELGEGFETATLAALSREYVLRGMKPKLLALYKSRIDNTALVEARKTAEAAMKQEEEQRKLNEAGVISQVENDLQGF